jgi:hypothetical protein
MRHLHIEIKEMTLGKGNEGILSEQREQKIKMNAP